MYPQKRYDLVPYLFGQIVIKINYGGQLLIFFLTVR